MSIPKLLTLCSFALFAMPGVIATQLAAQAAPQDTIRSKTVFVRLGAGSPQVRANAIGTFAPACDRNEVSSEEGVADACLAHIANQLQSSIEQEGKAGWRLVQVIPDAMVARRGRREYILVFTQQSSAVGNWTRTAEARLDSLQLKVDGAYADMMRVLRGSLTEVFGARALEGVTAEVQKGIEGDLRRRLDSLAIELRAELRNERRKP